MKKSPLPDRPIHATLPTVDFDLNKPEQYAAWFLEWIETISQPIATAEGTLKLRVFPNLPPLEVARDAALDVVEAHLIRCNKKLRSGRSLPTRNSGSPQDRS